MKIILSGCSGGGKSTLVAELARRGVATVPEPGLRIVQGAGPKPWDDPLGFAEAAIALARADLDGTPAGPVLFDRGLGDAIAAWEHAAGRPHPDRASLAGIFAPVVLIAPPWPEIHVRDATRRHDLTQAIAEYERLCAFYPALGFRLESLPRLPVAARADLVMTLISQ